MVFLENLRHSRSIRPKKKKGTYIYQGDIQKNQGDNLFDTPYSKKKS